MYILLCTNNKLWGAGRVCLYILRIDNECSDTWINNIRIITEGLTTEVLQLYYTIILLYVYTSSGPTPACLSPFQIPRLRYTNHRPSQEQKLHVSRITRTYIFYCITPPYTEHTQSLQHLTTVKHPKYVCTYTVNDLGHVKKTAERT